MRPQNTVREFGYLTPDSVPDDRVCRSFSIPNQAEWLGVFMGALLALTEEANWKQYGALTPEEAAAVMEQVFWEGYASTSSACPTVPTPFWDTVTDVDDEYPAGELAPWYGVASVAYASPPEVTFIERLGIWAIAGFIAYSGAPGAALYFLTIADEFVIKFKTHDLGGIVDIIVDASRVARVDTYSASPGILSVPIALDPDSAPHGLYIVKDDDPDTSIQVVRSELSPDEVSPPKIRYDDTCECVQTQLPDGTWIDNPAADPRTSTVYLYPPVSDSDPQCKAAANRTRWVSDFIDEVLDVLAVSSDAGGLLTLLVGILLELGPFGILIDLVLALALVLFSFGVTALSAAFTSTVYDTLLCILYCNSGTDGSIAEANFTDIVDACGSDIGGTAGTVLQAMFTLMGWVGLNNTANVKDAPADCSACECTVCVDALNGNGEQGWSAYSGSLANGCTTTYNATPDWYYNDVNCSSWVFCCAIQNVDIMTSVQATVSGREFTSNPAYAWEIYIDGVSQGYHQENFGEVDNLVIEFIPESQLVGVEVIIRFWMAERIAGDASGWAAITAITLCS